MFHKIFWYSIEVMDKTVMVVDIFKSVDNLFGIKLFIHRLSIASTWYRQIMVKVRRADGGCIYS